MASEGAINPDDVLADLPAATDVVEAAEKVVPADAGARPAAPRSLTGVVAATSSMLGFKTRSSPLVAPGLPPGWPHSTVTNDDDRGERDHPAGKDIRGPARHIGRVLAEIQCVGTHRVDRARCHRARDIGQ